MGSPLNISLLHSLNLFQGIYLLLLQLPTASHSLFSTHICSLPHRLSQHFGSLTAHYYPSILFLPHDLSDFAPRAKLPNAGLKGTNIDITKIVVLGIMLEGQV